MIANISTAELETIEHLIREELQRLTEIDKLTPDYEAKLNKALKLVVLNWNWEQA